MDARWRKINDRWRLELFVGDQPVSRLTLLRRTIHIGCARVSMGGIAGVFTEEAHRSEGYANRCMHLAIERMRSRKDAVSMLYGINDYYDRAGYASVDPVTTLKIEPGEILQHTDRNYAVRSFKKRQDSDRLARFYNRQNATRTGTAVRTGQFIGNLRCAIALAVDKSDRIVGHALYDKQTEEGLLHVWEIEGINAEAYASLLLFLAKRAHKGQAEAVHYWSIENHPSAQFCMRYRCLYTRYSQRNGGGMARIIDLDTLAGQMLPALQDEWSRAKHPFKGVVSVNTDIGAFKLKLSSSTVCLCENDAREDYAVEMRQSALTQLIFGYRTVRDVALERDVSIPRPLVDVFEGLFPAGRIAGTWPEDEF